MPVHIPFVKDYVNSRGIDWVFMTPAAPHQGGIYEAAIKSSKYHLRRILGKTAYSYEHLITISTKIEAVLSSRPLYALYDDPNEPMAITPAHLVLRRALILPPPIASPA